MPNTRKGSCRFIRGKRAEIEEASESVMEATVANVNNSNGKRIPKTKMGRKCKVEPPTASDQDEDFVPSTLNKSGKAQAIKLKKMAKQIENSQSSSIETKSSFVEDSQIMEMHLGAEEENYFSDESDPEPEQDSMGEESAHNNNASVLMNKSRQNFDDDTTHDVNENKSE